MKRFSQIFAVVLTLSLLAGCTKESYDKWLTSGTWNLNSYSLDQKKVVTTTYTGASVTQNDVVTDETTQTLSGGNATTVTFHSDAPATGTTSSSTETDVSKITTTVAFDKGGTYTQTNTSQAVSTQLTTSPGTVGAVNNITSTPATTTNKNDWAWLEDGTIKDQINLAGWGLVMIKLTKSSMTLTYNPTTTTTQTLHDATFGDYTVTTTTTTTDTWTFGK